VDYLYASAAMPFALVPVEAPLPGDPQGPKEPLADGSLSTFRPLQDLLAAGPAEVVVVSAAAGELPERSYADNIFGTAVGAFDFLARAEEILRQTIRRHDREWWAHQTRTKRVFLRLRDRLPAAARALMECQELTEALAGVATCPVATIRPGAPLPGTADDFRRPRIRAALEEGARAARAWLAEGPDQSGPAAGGE
jgi:predicted acylesterase/phospholipase RssA